MEKKVLTTDELQLLRNFQTDKDKIMSDFGFYEMQIQELKIKKQLLVDNLLNLKKEEEKIGSELQSKYGDGNIDLNSGEFISII